MLKCKSERDSEVGVRPFNRFDTLTLSDGKTHNAQDSQQSDDLDL